MILLGSLLLVAVSIICAERDYFYRPDNDTWDNARLRCQACYKDLTTITPTNAEFLGRNLTSDYWIGLRQIINGSKCWSRWANGEPVLYQNWYPGHPVPKKKPEPQPTCPPPPISNKTMTGGMQCPAFARLCACLNSSDDSDDYLMSRSTMFNTTNNRSNENGMMWCPALANLCDCLNSSKGNGSSIAESTTVFSTSNFVTSPTPTMLIPISSQTITNRNDLEPEYIEDSCVALLSFGMWQEKQCNKSLPYICYDDRFYGHVEISNVTTIGGNLSWSEAGINITHYRVEINGNTSGNVTNETSYQIKGLDPGTLYKVQVIPVKCGRDLNAQNISFYTLPEDIRNLRKVSVEINAINLSWNPSRGTNVCYLVNTEPGNTNKTCSSENFYIRNLQPGQNYFFTVKAVVNETIFGQPGIIHACTKPSKVINLVSSNNDSSIITATWDSPDNNSSRYSYKIVLGNETHKQNVEYVESKYITMQNLTPGTTYTLNVSVNATNCLEEGEAASIIAYTRPNSVSNLQLTSTNDSITATWEQATGSYAWFNVTISSSMSVNVSFPTYNTTYLNYTFLSLGTAASYTVNITTYVNSYLSSSLVSKSIFTKPNSPGKVTVQNLNSTAVILSWGIPENSKGVTGINYLVNYVSDFWPHTGNLSIIGNTSVVITGLKSGSKYKFNVTVWAGESRSLPSKAEQLTTPQTRTVSFMMLCSSSIPLHCMNSGTMQDVLNVMTGRIKQEFKDDVFWNLSLSVRN